MTDFEKLRTFISFFEPGRIISRKDIMRRKLGGTITIDNYRNWFTLAGYLKIISRGRYEVLKTPPHSLTSRTLRKEAYPHWKNWFEYRHLKNKA